MDGGSENCNKAMLGLCELLVMKRLTKKVVWTRLPVGHSHADIDALFAKIWKLARSLSITSPRQYTKIIERALKAPDKIVNVKDVFMIPNLVEYLEKYTDKDIRNYAKLDDTKLQLIFEAVPIPNDYPGGVKVNDYPDKCCFIVTMSFFLSGDLQILRQGQSHRNRERCAECSMRVPSTSNTRHDSSKS